MRIVKVIPHPYFRITLFHFNARYQLKLEDAFYEEHIKFREEEVNPGNEAVVIKMLENFDFSTYRQRFESLHRDRLAMLQLVSNDLP